MLAIQRLEDDVKKGLTSQLYFCYSNDGFLLSEAVKLIRAHFPPISIETYESLEEIDIATLTSATSLFAERRILLIYNFEKIRKKDKRIEWLKKIVEKKASHITVFFLCNAEAKELAEDINFLKGHFRFGIFPLDIQERDLHEWIIYKASKSGLKLRRDAIDYLIDLTAGQPGLISSEVEKISLLVNQSEIGISDIKEILAENAEYSSFDLIDAIQSKDKGKAFKILQSLQNTESDMILGALNWHFTYRAKADLKLYSLLYKANLSLRQAKPCVLDVLVYELMQD
ncbi:DNA polymerase III subunit delta [Thermodesulfovibrio hydrogeniphilus]